MKRLDFLGDSLARIREFPAEARSEVGFQLRRAQEGEDPADWKPLKEVGPGVRELRVREASGAFRVVYLATLPDRIAVLHAFQKKTQQTPQRDIELAAKRLREMKE
ncbi:type II toxin-antitoxin system RelE/ParE family toxin [Methylobacterium isbiliense]|uniref:type II toxin-antitoxin system RelE/ParE family toxin n=1 Tax=Methylobacterium isbiliense TaxID=315478 RepID=UPI001EE35E05|nr:type II toxin-antitoxin system RelE/ParE family toxin [Methylobacterium isbiliense]MDN3627353.1 type II toxin-antitoxin system RelE/ParE family toxin [Methylobacterium isbiliense]